MEHMMGYHDKDEHTGQWQRYGQDRCWEHLAENLAQDIQQLEMINSTRSNNGRRSIWMKSIENSSRQFSRKLDGARDL